MLTGQLWISAHWEGLVSTELPHWLCALLPGEDVLQGLGHLPHVRLNPWKDMRLPCPWVATRGFLLALPCLF